MHFNIIMSDFGNEPTRSSAVDFIRLYVLEHIILSFVNYFSYFITYRDCVEVGSNKQVRFYILG